MSPEQVRGAETDRRSDLFSVGVLLYEMVSGRRPFDDSSSAATAAAILTRDPLPLARFAPDTPAELERIVAKSLRKDPEERYQTAADLLVDLRALKDERTFQARLERSGPPSDRPQRPPHRASRQRARPRFRAAHAARPSSRLPRWPAAGGGGNSARMWREPPRNCRSLRHSPRRAATSRRTIWRSP